MPFAQQFCVTKYDPAYRDANGVYQRDEWTAISDVGTAYDGVVLTLEAYQRVEDAYVDAALAFLAEAGVETLTVRDLEHGAGIVAGLQNGATLTLSQAGPALRAMLREATWFRLDAPDAYVHVGWDYYMYVGVPRVCPAATKLAGVRGLFVEEISASPYARGEHEG